MVRKFAPKRRKVTFLVEADELSTLTPASILTHQSPIARKSSSPSPPSHSQTKIVARGKRARAIEDETEDNYVLQCPAKKRARNTKLSDIEDLSKPTAPLRGSARTISKKPANGSKSIKLQSKPPQVAKSRQPAKAQVRPPPIHGLRSTRAAKVAEAAFLKEAGMATSEDLPPSARISLSDINKDIRRCAAEVKLRDAQVFWENRDFRHLHDATMEVSSLVSQHILPWYQEAYPGEDVKKKVPWYVRYQSIRDSCLDLCLTDSTQQWHRRRWEEWDGTNIPSHNLLEGWQWDKVKAEAEWRHAQAQSNEKWQRLRKAQKTATSKEFNRLGDLFRNRYIDQASYLKLH